MIRRWRKLIALYITLPIGAVLFVIGYWHGLIGVMITAGICVIASIVNLLT